MGGDPNLARRVLETVADREECSIFDLEERLYEAIDPVEVAALGERETDESLEFSYHGYRIVVDTERQIQIEPETADATERRRPV